VIRLPKKNRKREPQMKGSNQDLDILITPFTDRVKKELTRPQVVKKELTRPRVDKTAIKQGLKTAIKQV
jgi:hypothetical protein